MKNDVNVLDELEEIIIKALLPTMTLLKVEAKLDGDVRTITRNIISKVGLRIAFGKEIADQIILGETKKNE